MKKVLLAVDGSTHAESAARWIAGEVKSRGPLMVHLLNVQPAPTGYQTHGMEAQTIAKLAQEHGREAIKDARQILESAGVPVEQEVLQGNPWNLIVHRAEASGCDTIVMGRRGLGAVAGMLVGSVASKVLHLSTLPVVLVR